MRILVLGDFHIPTRAKNIPKEILSVLKKEEFDLVLCTGDLIDKSVLTSLTKLGPVKWVVGNMDYFEGPSAEKITAGKVKIGLIHGTEIFPRGDINQLHKKAVQMGVNVLISGHTHALSVNLEKGVLLLNPGSATGVWGGGPASLKPSFMILEINGEKIKVSSFELTGGKLHRKESLFKKVDDKMVKA